LDDDGEAATLDVQDDGVGMDPAVIARRVSEGHIGLASHRARIETLGGSVAFLPAERGTWVRVWLPLRSSGRDATATPDPRNRANPVADTGR
jgi:two-component system NarL family sensor kinase